MSTDFLFTIEVFAPALLAGVLVVSTHVPLGREVLKRGIIFVDLAIAQIAALGVIIAMQLNLSPKGWALQVLATASALGGALILHILERRFGEVLEALIGIVFVLAATAGLLLLSNDPHGAEQMKDLLSGQILWVSYAKLIPVAILYVVILLLWFGRWWPASRLKFYILFALSVTASLQLVGVYLVFATLIVPALSMRRLQGKRAVFGAYAVGVIAYALGLMGSALFDFPAGPMVVWALAVSGVVLSRLARANKPAV